MAPAMTKDQEMAQFIQEADSLIQDLTTTNEKLASENEQLKQRLASQKEASDTTTQATPVLEKEAVEQTVDNLVAAGLEKSANRDGLVNRILEHPETVLQCLDKIAEHRKPNAGAVPSLGKVAGAGSQPEGQRESDRVFEERFPTV